LSIAAATGVISGTLSNQAANASPYTVTVSASDGHNTGSATFTWNVTDITTPTVTNPGSHTTNEGTTFLLAVSASDSDNDALTYSASNLPAGLTINPTTGVVSGTLANQSAGTYTVTVRASDNFNTGSAAFSWTVTDVTAPTVTNPGTQNSS